PVGPRPRVPARDLRAAGAVRGPPGARLHEPLPALGGDGRRCRGGRARERLLRRRAAGARTAPQQAHARQGPGGPPAGGGAAGRSRGGRHAHRLLQLGRQHAAAGVPPPRQERREDGGGRDAGHPRGAGRGPAALGRGAPAAGARAAGPGAAGRGAAARKRGPGAGVTLLVRAHGPPPIAEFGTMAAACAPGFGPPPPRRSHPRPRTKAQACLALVPDAAATLEHGEKSRPRPQTSFPSWIGL
ncbi:unnamed protein product, partial [Prorocentrum cordatum]